MQYIMVHDERRAWHFESAGLDLSKTREAPAQGWRWIVDTDVEPQFESSRKFIAYWLRKCRTGRLPMRSDLRPASIGWLIRNLFVVEFRPERDDFVYSFIGNEIVSAFGVDNNNATMAEAYADEAQCQAVRDVYSFILEAGRPYTSAGQVWSTDGAWATFEAVHLPVREPFNGKAIVGAMFFIDSVDEEIV